MEGIYRHDEELVRYTVEAAQRLGDRAPLMVIETEDDHFLGQVATMDYDHFTIHTGYVGRPPVVRFDEVENLYLVSQHLLIEVVG